MKPRRAVVTLELETDLTINELKNYYQWNTGWSGGIVRVKQVQVNVIQKSKKKPRPRK